jgi:hypothetical protein
LAMLLQIGYGSCQHGPDPSTLDAASSPVLYRKSGVWYYRLAFKTWNNSRSQYWSRMQHCIHFVLVPDLKNLVLHSLAAWRPCSRENSNLLVVNLVQVYYHLVRNNANQTHNDKSHKGKWRTMFLYDKFFR